MNCFKALVAFALLCVTLPLFGGWRTPEPVVIGYFLISGLVGLNIADLFLLNAFTKLGAARTLMLYGFQPLIIGVGALIMFGQPLNPMKLVAVAFMIACLFTLSLESYRTHKKWAIGGLLIALAGVSLDACGVLITRKAFETTAALTPVEGHFYRCLGALAGFAVMALFKPFPLVEGFTRWPKRERILILAASFGGTYFSLLLYLHAVKFWPPGLDCRHHDYRSHVRNRSRVLHQAQMAEPIPDHGVHVLHRGILRSLVDLNA